MLCFLPDGLEMVCLLFVTIAAEILPKRIGKTGMEKGIQQGFRWMPFSMPVFPMRFGSISAAIVTKRRQTISSPSGRKQSIQIPSDNAWLTVIKHGSCKGDG